MPQRRDVPDNLVVAIATTDDWFHAGTPEELVAHGHSHSHPVTGHAAHDDADPGHDGTGNGRNGRRLEFDFFDVDGRPLRPVLGIDLGVIRFVPFGDPEPDTVEARLRRAINVGLAFLAENPDRFPSRSLPALPGEGDLPALAHWARDAMARDDRGHLGGWFHNVMHALLG